MLDQSATQHVRCLGQMLGSVHQRCAILLISGPYSDLLDVSKNLLICSWSIVCMATSEMSEH